MPGALGPQEVPGLKGNKGNPGHTTIGAAGLPGKDSLPGVPGLPGPAGKLFMSVFGLETRCDPDCRTVMNFEGGSISLV